MSGNHEVHEEYRGHGGHEGHEEWTGLPAATFEPALARRTILRIATFVVSVISDLRVSVVD